MMNLSVLPKKRGDLIADQIPGFRIAKEKNKSMPPLLLLI
jgi:hypothetical protein